MISQPGLKIIEEIDPHWIKHQQDKPDPGQPGLARKIARSIVNHAPTPHLSSSVQFRDLIANRCAFDLQVGLV